MTREGAVLVEFAIIAPIMVLMAVGRDGDAPEHVARVRHAGGGEGREPVTRDRRRLGELPAPGGVVHREHSSLRHRGVGTVAVQTVIVPVGSVSAVACWPLNSKPS